MALVFDGLSDFEGLVKAGIVHHQHRRWREFGDQVFREPAMKDLCVYGAFEEADSHHRRTAERADNIRASFRAPVVEADAPLAARGIAMRPWHVMGKAAFIKINNGLAGIFMALDRLLKPPPSFGTRPGMAQSFFYASPPCA